MCRVVALLRKAWCREESGELGHEILAHRNVPLDVLARELGLPLSFGARRRALAAAALGLAAGCAYQAASGAGARPEMSMCTKPARPKAKPGHISAWYQSICSRVQPAPPPNAADPTAAGPPGTTRAAPTTGTAKET